ncbi:MAG: hypothetical protein ACLUR5_01595 [Eubacterium ventriosum]
MKNREMIHYWIGTETKRELIKQLETDGRQIFCVIDELPLLSTHKKREIKDRGKLRCSKRT